MTGHSTITHRILQAITFLWFAVSAQAWAVDTDADGVDNASDNCLIIANANQRDTDTDGFGNVCDADFNQDGITNFLDLFFTRLRVL